LVDTLYFWSSKFLPNNTVRVAQLPGDNFYCSIKWNPLGEYIGGGSNEGSLHLYDAVTQMGFREDLIHTNRISSMSWMNSNIVSTGSRDNSIKMYDIRTGTVEATLRRHTQEVCGLKWHPTGAYLASGGNDNLIHLWDPRK
jgi:cell division cycle protein 20 (cofactor of APC complex)